jgi:hypothetical protein
MKTTKPIGNLPFQGECVLFPINPGRCPGLKYVGLSARQKQRFNLIKQEIELLKEYRQALIFEAVTGKIRVDIKAESLC